jgi:hypothetical protein
VISQRKSYMILDMNSAIDIDVLLNQCENYLTENDIMNLVKQCLYKLCIHQPDNPIQFLKQYFTTQEYEQVSVFSYSIYFTDIYLFYVYVYNEYPRIHDLFYVPTACWILKCTTFCR